MSGPAPAARRIEVYGTVQGVGYRPFVHRLATGLGLDGWVCNANGHVEVAASGRPDLVEAFVRRLRLEAPALATVRGVLVRELGGRPPAPGSGFTVRVSTSGPDDACRREVPPDAATCAQCLRELFDPGDRRFRYPFVNCTDCGPRATVITDLPYDRERTTMRAFPLCAGCAAEYRDPADRRFHAEPLACPRCGPRLDWRPAGQQAPGGGPEDATVIGEDALCAAVATVAGGGIVAVKGLGGYQLVCDATCGRAVAELRRRKHRPAKPFAVMVRDVAGARRIAHVSADEGAVLASAARPVVLLDAAGGDPGAAGSGLAGEVHPGTGRVGVFLPTTGLHHLLLHELDRPLVVTSGNLADEPIAVDDATAGRTLAAVADGFLGHDRPIRARYDDSVVQVAAGAVRTVRRARGYAPAPLPLPVRATVPLVAAGAQLKHTFALATGDRAHLGPHTGDLEDVRTLAAFEGCYAELVRLTGVRPRLVAHDLHPGYLSTQWASGLPVDRRVPVQHHHAHVAACAAEHGERGPFVGVAYDGLGLGDDGTLWGGEVLVADLAGYRRAGRFSRAPLPGGAAAVRRPARMALGYLFGGESLGGPAPDPELVRPFVERLDAHEARVVRAMVERGFNSPPASSAGRLFDAVACLLGLGDEVSYEGQAAVALESAAGSVRADALPWRLVRAGGLWVYDPSVTLSALLRAVAEQVPVARIAAGFHSTLAEVTAAMVERVVAEGAPPVVCLSGGCFQNVRLLTQVRQQLQDRGLRVLVGSAVPVGDGGISYGQAAVAAARTAGG